MGCKWLLNARTGILFACMVICVGTAMSQAHSAYYEIFEPLPRSLSISENVFGFHDTSGVLTIHDILLADSLLFKPRSAFESTNDFPAVIWLKVAIRNIHHESIDGFLTMCNRIDSSVVYRVNDRQIISRLVTGNALRTAPNSLPGMYNHVSIHLDPGQMHQYYIRNYFSSYVTPTHQVELHLNDRETMVYTIFERFNWQSFYSGVMLMFSLVSFFMYILFKERVFIYFGLVQISFVFYFAVLSNFYQSLGFPLAFIDFTWAQSLSVGLLIGLSFLFIAKFVNLHRHIPVIHNIYMVLTLCIVVYQLAIRVHIANMNTAIAIGNYMIMAWIALTVGSLLWLLRKKEKSAIHLSVALMTLIVSFVILTLTFMGYLPRNQFTQTAVQTGTFLFSLLVFYGLSEKVSTINRAKQQAETMNDLKSAFYTNLSHEFRTPLTLIMGPLQQIRDKFDQPEVLRLVDTAHKNADRLLLMINQLLDLSRIESGKTSLNIAKKDISAFVKGLAMSFESLAEMKNIRLHVTGDTDENLLWFDPESMEKIFANLLSNAFKFTPDGGSITIAISDRKKTVKINISDTGIGIPQSKLPYIFDRFFQADNPASDVAQGSGIGLALVREMVEMHKGNIAVSSIPDKGTVMSLTFLKGSSHFSDQTVMNKSESHLGQIAAGKHVEKAIEHFPEQEKPAPVLRKNAHRKKPLILLVEDNLDVRRYIKNQFVDQYKVMEAKNGLEGLEMAENFMPEIIISDVMMPKMNGIELCDALKRNVNTCHIPIILLTARARHQEKLKGLEYGADDYLTKPFDSKELLVRVRKLIELRIILRNKILETPALSYTGLSLSPLDAAFMEQINASIHHNLSDTQYSADVMANELNMSRGQLNRKVKSLTDLSPSRYIQHVRLSQSLIMLQEQAGNVSEVAFSSGFNSTAYFVKCFRERYGKTPGAV